MANMQLVTATVQQLLNQTSALLNHTGDYRIEDDIVESLERDIRRAMMQLRRCRNASRPINRLPPELLRMIFSHLRPPPSSRWSTRLTDYPRYAPYKPLITALLVCHKWHTIGSKAASLWTDIDFVRQDTFASVLLIRSLRAPIRLCGRLQEDRTFEMTIIDHGARIRELDLSTGVELSDPLPALRSVLAVDMPQLRLLAIFCRRRDIHGQSPPLLDHATGALPSLQALLLQGFLFVPSGPLHRLTHLYLAWAESVSVSNMLKLLRTTPALEVLCIRPYYGALERPHGIPSTIASPSVALPRCHSVQISGFTSTAVHDLMLSLEVPSLASLRLSNTFANGETLALTPLVPRTLTAHRTINRLAFDFGGTGTCFRAVFHGNDVMLTMGINAVEVPEAERQRWAKLNDLPALFPLSTVEEFHFQASRWDAAQNLFCHLAAHVPAVSTLYVEHDAGWDDDDEAGVLALASAVAAPLSPSLSLSLDSDAAGPGALFPHLAHLELVLSAIPQEFCSRLASALARREASGARRLRTLRIRLGQNHSSRWAGRWCFDPEPEYGDTGIFDHVDCAEIDPEQRGCKVHEDGRCPEHARWAVCGKGWGEWEDPVPARGARHDYWEG